MTDVSGTQTVEFSHPINIDNQTQTRIYIWHRNAENPNDFPVHARTVLFWNHGIGEYACRNRKLAHKLFELVPGLDAFVSYDMRGHGSAIAGNKPCKVAGVATLTNDLNTVLRWCVSQFDPVTKFLIAGHSLGGLVIASSASNQQSVLNSDAKSQICGVMLSSAAIKVFVSGRVNQLLAPLASVITMMPGSRTITKSNDIPPQELSHDEIEVNAYINDKNIHNVVSFGLASDMLSFGDEICSAVQADTSHALLINAVPVLLIHGMKDRVVNLVGTENLAGSIRNQQNVTKVLVPGARHEVYNELPEHGQLMYFENVSGFIARTLADA